MFKISRKTDYAVRVLVALAQSQPGTRIPTQQVQERTLVPFPFLRRIVAELSKAGLLIAIPGTHGGLFLADIPENITLHKVFEVIEGTLCISDCLHSPQECPLNSQCPVRLRWGQLQSAVATSLKSTTIAQLAREAQAIHDPATNGDTHTRAVD